MQNKNSYVPDPGAGKFVEQLKEVYVDARLPRPNLEVDNSTVRPNHGSMTDLTRQEVDAKFAASEAKVDARLATFDASIKTGFADIRSEFSAMRADFAKMQTDGHKGTIDLFKWGTALLVSLASVTVAIIVFIVNTALKAPQAPAQQASAPAAITQPSTQTPVPAQPPVKP
jgi:broad specificity phosphatase PhoE